MFTEEYDSVCKAAEGKITLMKKNPVGYFLASALAGIYVGFGVLLAFTAGGLLSGTAYGKIVMGLTFGVALSLVVMAGAELFTGNNFVLCAGMLKKTTRVRDVLLLWAFCWLGNLTGAVLLALTYHVTGLGAGTAAGQFMADSAAVKMALSFWELLFRGILCNVLVCLAVWCGFRCKSESGKLIMIFWCLLAFITTGFEHSIANMTLLTIALLNPCGASLSVGGWFYNLAVSTLGNMIGAVVFVALPYYFISRQKQKKQVPQEKTEQKTSDHEGEE